MIMNGDFAYLKHIGYLTILQPMLITQTENLLRELWQTVVDIVMYHLQLLLFSGLFRIYHLYHHSLLCLLSTKVKLFFALHFPLLVHQQINTTVADTRKQVCLQRFRLEVGTATKQLSKHLTHHILAVSIIVQHPSCQSEHPVIMTSEECFEFSFVYHLSLVFLYYIQSDTSFS